MDNLLVWVNEYYETLTIISIVIGLLLYCVIQLWVYHEVCGHHGGFLEGADHLPNPLTTSGSWKYMLIVRRMRNEFPHYWMMYKISYGILFGVFFLPDILSEFI